MPYQPDNHRRRSIRSPDFDYSCVGAYFVTVCAYERECLFGEIVGGGMRLNEAGVIVQHAWDALPNHFQHVQLDQFVIMPNHVHGIVVLVNHDHPDVGAQHAAPLVDTYDPCWAQHAAPLHDMLPRPNVMPRSLGAVVRSFKSAATKQINKLRHTPAHPVWQRNYYEHVIRDDRDLAVIREYVAENPATWADDENYTFTI